ncbi:MAG: hypothetical protein WBV64_18345 [Mycobacterium sp.]
MSYEQALADVLTHPESGPVPAAVLEWLVTGRCPSRPATVIDRAQVNPRWSRTLDW